MFLVKKLLKYTYDPIEWKWERLTAKEKELISPEDFQDLHAWIMESP